MHAFNIERICLNPYDPITPYITQQKVGWELKVTKKLTGMSKDCPPVLIFPRHGEPLQPEITLGISPHFRERRNRLGHWRQLFCYGNVGYGTVGPTHKSQLPKTVLDPTQDVYREPPLPRDLGGRHGDLGTGRAGRVYRRFDVFHQ